MKPNSEVVLITEVYSALLPSGKFETLHRVS